MDKSKVYFDKLESILDKEEEFLLQARREHHTSWDNHILTLSIAAVGFSFTFLPLQDTGVIWLAYVGIFSFVFSIFFTTFNYIVSDHGMELAYKNHTARRIQHDKVFHRVNKLKREMGNLKPEDTDKIQGARDNCWNDVEKIYAERNPENEKNDIENNNKKVRFLNTAKTYAFLIGVISISIYSLCNIDMFNK